MRMRIIEVAKLGVGACLVYLVVAACAVRKSPTNVSPPAPISDALAEGHKGGTRLKVRFYEGSDGSRQFIGFWDSQLGTACTVSDRTMTTDGKVRCVPAESYGQVAYSDSACKNLLGLVVPKDQEQPTLRVHRNDAGAGYVLTKLGAPAAPAATIYVAHGRHGACLAQQLPPDAVSIYPLGAELPPSTLVEMTMKTE